MIESIISGIVYRVIPAEWLPLILVILAALVGVEQWLASTKRIQANSTLQLIVGVAKKIINKGGASGTGTTGTGQKDGGDTGPSVSPKNP